MALKAEEEEKAGKGKAAGTDAETETDTDTETDPKLVKLVNQAVTGQLKRAMRSLPDTLGALLDEKLAALKPSGADAPAAGKDKTGEKGSGTGAAAESAELEQLRADMAAQKKRLADQEFRALEKEAYADVKAQLQGKVKPESLDMALKLMKADGLVKLDVKKGTYSVKGPDGELLDVEEGVAEWLKGDGALFVLQQPAPGARPKPKLSAPVRAPARPGGGSNNDNLTPAQRTAYALAAKGLSLT